MDRYLFTRYIHDSAVIKMLFWLLKHGKWSITWYFGRALMRCYGMIPVMAILDFCFYYYVNWVNSNVITCRLPWQPDGIKFTLCVSGQKSAFSHLWKTMRWIEKWLPPFRTVSTSSIIMQSLDEIKLCHSNIAKIRIDSPKTAWNEQVCAHQVIQEAVGAKRWCFWLSRLICLRVGGHSLYKYCVTV